MGTMLSVRSRFGAYTPETFRPRDELASQKYRNSQLTQAVVGAVQDMTRRSPLLWKHTAAMREMGLQMAQMAGMNWRWLNRLDLALTFHDFGKLKCTEFMDDSVWDEDRRELYRERHSLFSSLLFLRFDRGISNLRRESDRRSLAQIMYWIRFHHHIWKLKWIAARVSSKPKAYLFGALIIFVSDTCTAFLEPRAHRNGRPRTVEEALAESLGELVGRSKGQAAGIFGKLALFRAYFLAYRYLSGSGKSPTARISALRRFYPLYRQMLACAQSKTV